MNIKEIKNKIYGKNHLGGLIWLEKIGCDVFFVNATNGACKILKRQQDLDEVLNCKLYDFGV